MVIGSLKNKFHNPQSFSELMRLFKFLILFLYHRYSRVNPKIVSPHVKNIFQVCINIGVNENQISRGINTAAVASSRFR